VEKRKPPRLTHRDARGGQARRQVRQEYFCDSLAQISMILLAFLAAWRFDLLTEHIHDV
jgi:hypothetical protein